MSIDPFSFITSLVPAGTRALVARQGRDVRDENTTAPPPSLARGIAVVAVVPEWALRALAGAVTSLARELDRLDIRLRLDIRRTPSVSTGAGGSVEDLERRMLDLLAELHRLRRA